MTHDEAFLQAILENPDDDTPRLIYADWLEERDDPRGEFIRIQCRLAAMSADDERRSLLEGHARALLARHQDRWLGELRSCLNGWTFCRGFLDAITVPAATYVQRSPLPHPPTVRRVQVDLEGFEPSLYIVELVPESVARENTVLPIGLRSRTLVMAASEPQDAEMWAKMQFILNRDIQFVAANGEQLMEAINRLYGAYETESVDSVLHEFVNPAIDFETGSDSEDVVAFKLLALIILEAQALYADQIRIQPLPDCMQVSYRIDRIWVERDAPPRRLLNPVVGQIRRLAGLASADESVVQTGLLRGNAFGSRPDLAVHLHPSGQGPSLTLLFMPMNEV
jgi:uncharacterized protein (TIGR02996 family)